METLGIWLASQCKLTTSMKKKAMKIGRFPFPVWRPYLVRLLKFLVARVETIEWFKGALKTFLETLGFG